jgi:cellulose synthase/poly-beta-1,6-N-acetylglucosamine synthase-like glycosyltransferase
VVCAFRNERQALPILLARLDALDYETSRLSVCLVDDGSSDGGTLVAETWIRDRSNARLLILGASVGKAAALNQAVATLPADVELVAIFDADQWPEAECLRHLYSSFFDSRVAAVGVFARRSALAKARPSLRQAVVVLASGPIMFAVDVALSLSTGVSTLTGGRVDWKSRPVPDVPNSFESV